MMGLRRANPRLLIARRRVRVSSPNATQVRAATARLRLPSEIVDFLYHLIRRVRLWEKMSKIGDIGLQGWGGA